jgi:hypothetical protein
MKYVIDTIGFGRDLKYHAMFYDSDGKIFDYWNQYSKLNNLNKFVQEWNYFFLTKNSTLLFV